MHSAPIFICPMLWKLYSFALCILQTCYSTLLILPRSQPQQHKHTHTHKSPYTFIEPTTGQYRTINKGQCNKSASKIKIVCCYDSTDTDTIEIHIGSGTMPMHNTYRCVAVRLNHSSYHLSLFFRAFFYFLALVHEI